METDLLPGKRFQQNKIHSKPFLATSFLVTPLVGKPRRKDRLFLYDRRSEQSTTQLVMADPNRNTDTGGTDDKRYADDAALGRVVVREERHVLGNREDMAGAGRPCRTTQTMIPYLFPPTGCYSEKIFSYSHFFRLDDLSFWNFTTRQNTTENKYTHSTN